MPRKSDAPNTGSHNDIGSKIRAARMANGRSLRQLASDVGVSASLLSQVETGKVQPSVATLYALVNALGMSLDSILGVAHEGGRHDGGEVPVGTNQPLTNGSSLSAHRFVQRRNDNPTLEMENGVRWEQLSGSNDDLEILLVTYQPGASSSADGKLMRHSGHEFAYLLEGKLTVQVGFDVFEVEAGDSFNFDSTTPHLYVNHGSTPARGIWYTPGRYSELPAARFGRSLLAAAPTTADYASQIAEPEGSGAVG